MFDFLNPFKFIAIIGPILLVSIACFCVIYVALLGFTAMNLPFGREIALFWLAGGTLRSLVITVEGGDLWPFVQNPYYPLVSQGPALVPWVIPLHGNYRITAGFLDPEYEKEFGRPHYGIDFSCPGGTPVYATIGGRIYVAGDNELPNTGLGLRIGIDNDSFATEYGHLSVSLVKYGDVVQPGALIGYTGNTGQGTGSHLHYQVMYDYDYVDPTQFWQGPVSEVTTRDGRRVPLPPDALSSQPAPAYTRPSAGGGTGGAMGQYFPTNPPPVPDDWEQRGIPYISGSLEQTYGVVYARRLSDAENHGNLRLFGRVLDASGQGVGGVTVRCFSDAGWESLLVTNPDGSYEYGGFSREFGVQLEIKDDSSQRVYNFFFVHPSAGGHCSYEVIWRKQ